MIPVTLVWTFGLKMHNIHCPDSTLILNWSCFVISTVCQSVEAFAIRALHFTPDITIVRSSLRQRESYRFDSYHWLWYIFWGFLILRILCYSCFSDKQTIAILKLSDKQSQFDLGTYIPATTLASNVSNHPSVLGQWHHLNPYLFL